MVPPVKLSGHNFALYAELSPQYDITEPSNRAPHRAQRGGVEDVSAGIRIDNALPLRSGFRRPIPASARLDRSAGKRFRPPQLDVR
jgi:hypothetical protein